MKIYHFALLFIVFFIAIVIKTDVAIGDMKSIEKEKLILTNNLDSATADAIHYLAKTGSYGTDSINKDEVTATFFTSLYSSLGIISDRNAQSEIEMYIPVILLSDTDGYYVYYYDQFKGADGLTYTERKWTEKLPYYYEDEHFVYRFTLTDLVSIYDIKSLLSPSKEVITLDYHEIQTSDEFKNFRNQHSDCFLLKDDKLELVRKGAIAAQLEKVLADYISRYNMIAKQNGITYNFSFPAKEEEDWAQYMDDVNMLVVFQGYPYGRENNYVFNKIASAGANVVKKANYYVEKKGWYYLAHKAGCPKLAASTTVLDETFESLDECAAMGAYCCDCIKDGSRVPEIK